MSKAKIIVLLAAGLIVAGAYLARTHHQAQEDVQIKQTLEKARVQDQLTAYELDLAAKEKKRDAEYKASLRDLENRRQNAEIASHQ